MNDISKEINQKLKGKQLQGFERAKQNVCENSIELDTLPDSIVIKYKTLSALHFA